MTTLRTSAFVSVSADSTSGLTVTSTCVYTDTIESIVESNTWFYFPDINTVHNVKYYVQRLCGTDVEGKNHI